MDNKELDQTLVLIKPDALKNSLTGYILSLLSELHTGLRFAGTKIVHVTRMLAAEHYAEHRGKIFYEALLEYIRGNLHYPNDPNKRRVIAIVYQGADAVKKIRNICGPTNPSANSADAEREVKLWFKPNSIPPAMRAYATEQSEDHFYYKNGKLFTAHEPGSTCILAPGDSAWVTDLQALRLHYAGSPAPMSLEAVVAKYLVNERLEND